MNAYMFWMIPMIKFVKIINKRRICVYLYRKQGTSLCPTISKLAFFYKFLSRYGVLMGKLYIFGKLNILAIKWGVDRRFNPNIDKMRGVVVCLCRSNFVYVLSLVNAYKKIFIFFMPPASNDAEAYSDCPVRRIRTRLTHLDCFVWCQYHLLQSFDICMDVVFEHSQHIHITWPHFDLDIDLILDLDLFKCVTFLVNPFGLFRLTSIPFATKLWYLHGCCQWTLSTHPHHLTSFWPWHWPNFS